jgi:hypothetical protein
MVGESKKRRRNPRQREGVGLASVDNEG